MNKLVPLILSGLLVLSTLAPANAAGTKQKIYKTYHYFVYLPTMVVTTLMGGIPILIAHANQKIDDTLEEAANEEILNETGWTPADVNVVPAK